MWSRGSSEGRRERAGAFVLAYIQTETRPLALRSTFSISSIATAFSLKTSTVAYQWKASARVRFL